MQTHKCMWKFKALGVACSWRLLVAALEDSSWLVVAPGGSSISSNSSSSCSCSSKDISSCSDFAYGFCGLSQNEQTLKSFDPLAEGIYLYPFSSLFIFLYMFVFLYIYTYIGIFLPLNIMLRFSFSSGRDRACRHCWISYFRTPSGKRLL